jgi:hypothetical protein
MAATWWRCFPQKLHCSASPSSLTCWIVAIGVGAVRPGSAITACAPLIHRSQMYKPGPAISFLTCFWLFPQKEQDRRFPESGTHPLYPGGSAQDRQACRWQALVVNCGFPGQGRFVYRLATAQCLRFPPRSGTRRVRHAPGPETFSLPCRFRVETQLLRCWSGPVSLSSWCRSMSPVSTRFWQPGGTGPGSALAHRAAHPRRDAFGVPYRG